MPDQNSNYASQDLLDLSDLENAKDKYGALSTGQLAPSSLSGIVLVVEDYLPNIMVITMMLQHFGFDTLTARNGAEALEHVSAAPSAFIAIFMDLQMLGMDGFETTRRIRQLESTKPFKNTIIGMTAHPLAGNHELCIAAGMNDYIPKPIHPDIMENKLRLLHVQQRHEAV